MAKTRSDLVSLIAKKLYVLEGGQPLDATVNASLLEVVNARIEFLRDEEVAYWADDAIPDAAYDPLAEYMLFWCCPILIPDRSEEQGFAARTQRGEMDLRRHTAKRSEGAAIQADYF